MTGPKEKKERSLGEQLMLKGTRCSSPKCAVVRKPYRPGMHGKKRSRALSEFGRQIKEKQKFKLSYGLDERNLRQTFKKAEQKTGSITTRLMELLERRLDNVIFRLGFAPSRSMARQLVVHGHIFVNKSRVRSPGYLVSLSDVVHVRAESRSKAAFRDLQESLKQYTAPSWLVLDKDKLEGKMIAMPDEESKFEVNLLVESFSK